MDSSPGPNRQKIYKNSTIVIRSLVPVPFVSALKELRHGQLNFFKFIAQNPSPSSDKTILGYFQVFITPFSPFKLLY